MTGTDLQSWLNAHGASLVVDGKPGKLTRSAIPAVFTNACAPIATSSDIATIATRLGCTPKQLRAIAKVESGGAAFDGQGRPKILFERHVFHRLTGGKHSVSPFSNPSYGGYGEDSWAKLSAAACLDAPAAFASCSWGRFQVMGSHWQGLGYPSAIEMAYSTVTSEAAHFDMLARYIERFNLKDELARISTNPADNKPFAIGYNGPDCERNAYPRKLADAMR